MYRLVIFSLLVGATIALPLENELETNTGRSISENNIEQQIEQYLKNQEVSFDLPLVASRVSVSARNLDNEELDFKVNFGSEVQARKKSKIKKIFLPILAFILIKAAILIPATLGILGIKAWNAMQLSFVSFVVAMGMAFWKMCTRVAEPVAHPQLLHPTLYDAHYALARSDDFGGQDLAYNSYVQ